MIKTLMTLPWQNLAIAAFTILVMTTVLLRWIGKRLNKRRPRAARSLARTANQLSTVMTLSGLGWSGEAMWEIAHKTIGLNGFYSAFIFAVFEIALLVSMIRAKIHMTRYNWPGRPGRTVWGVAVLMGVVACTITTHGLPEYLVRFAVPLVVAKLWWDGVVDGATKPATEDSDWTITPQKVLRWLRLKTPRVVNPTQQERDQLVKKLTELEFLRRYGIQRFGFKNRRAWRLMQLSLQADDAQIAEVRRRVTRANWFTTHPLTHLSDAPNDALVTQPDGARVMSVTHPVTHSGDAVVTQSTSASVTRAKPPLSSSDAGDEDASTRAARLLLAGRFTSTRKAADAVPGATDSTVRRRLRELTDAAVTQAGDAPVATPVTQAVAHPGGAMTHDGDAPVAHVNGHSPTLDSIRIS